MFVCCRLCFELYAFVISSRNCRRVSFARISRSQRYICTDRIETHAFELPLTIRIDLCLQRENKTMFVFGRKRTRSCTIPSAENKSSRLMLEILTTVLMVSNGVPVPPLISIIFSYAVFRGMCPSETPRMLFRSDGWWWCR